MSFVRRVTSNFKVNQMIALSNRLGQHIVHRQATLNVQSQFKAQINLVRFFSLQPELKTKIDNIVKQRKIVLFMKGSKDAPRCGFSNVITQILRMHGVDYDTVNVLDDEEIRQGIKEYSQWPTIPQLFIDGEFIGGCDIVMQMHQNGELISLFNKSNINSILKDAASADDKK